MEAISERDYDEAAACLKEGLRTLKVRNQERSTGYLILMRRLAHVSFLQDNYADSEKYFQVAVRVSQVITKNP